MQYLINSYLKKLIQKLPLNKKELIVISFLFITFIAGIAVKYSGWRTPNKFKYSEQDREFDTQMKTAFTELESKNLTTEQKQLSEDIKKAADSLTALNDIEGKDKKKLQAGKTININKALAGDLLMLPGVGEVTAERIIEYRELKGGFRKPEEIKNVKGIGDKKFEQMKEFIVVE